MSKPLTASVTPLRSAAPVPEKPRRAKCDRDVKLHIPEAVYDDLARVARADQRPVVNISASCWNGIYMEPWGGAVSDNHGASVSFGG
ncbi:MAG: hypothetical protein IPL99_26280 [Candidatus Competibacteraceae bacterium]|nr:hypothetical protein [Candidatus Competibacteraceae bacterium]